MNANSQTPVNVDIPPTHNARQQGEVSPSLMKNWLHAAGDRKGMSTTASDASSGVDGNPELASASSSDNALTELPASMQAQLLQERLRLAFDAEGRKGADAELTDVNTDASYPAPMLGFEATNALASNAKPMLMGRGDEAVDENAARAALAEQAYASDSVRADSVNLNAEDEGLQDDDFDESDLDKIAGEGQHREQHIAHDVKVEPPQAVAPRDDTDYRWIEKFTDRVLIEVEARAADRNLSVQLAHDVIPNATLILSRTGGRWQLNASTDNETAAHGIEDAEQALSARFAARGLGDIQVNIEHTTARRSANDDMNMGAYA